MDTPRWARILRERWYVVVAATLLGVLAAFAIGRSIPPNYAATATSFLRVEATDTNLLERSQFSLARIKSYVDLVSSPSVLQATIRDLDLETSLDALSSEVRANNPADTVLLEITAEASDPQTAARIANSVSRNLAKEISELESTDDRYTITLDLLIPAGTGHSTTNSQLTILLGLGLLGGLAVGIVLAALLVLLDPRVRTIEDVRRSSGLPVVAQLPSSLRRARPGRPFARDLDDALRGFLVDLRLLGGGVDPALIALVPATRRDPVDPVRLGLARTAARSGLAVSIVAVDPDDPLSVALRPPDAQVPEAGVVDEAELPVSEIMDPEVVKADEAEDAIEAEEAPEAEEADAKDAAAESPTPIHTRKRGSRARKRAAQSATLSEDDAVPAAEEPELELDLDAEPAATAAESDLDPELSAEPPAPSAMRRAATTASAAVTSTVGRVRTRFAREPMPVPEEPFSIVGLDETAASQHAREEALVGLVGDAVLDADTVILTARGDEELPALASLDAPSVLIVVDIRRTRRSKLRSISTALKFAGVHPAGVVLTSVSAHRRADLPSTWFESDRLQRPPVRAAARPRRSTPRSVPDAKATPSAKPEPVRRVDDPTDLTLDFGDQEAAAG